MRHPGPSTDYLRQILSAQAQRQLRPATSLYSRPNPKAANRLQETKGDAVSSQAQSSKCQSLENANLWNAQYQTNLRPDRRVCNSGCGAYLRAIAVSE